jgi:hypothetical protein
VPLVLALLLPAVPVDRPENAYREIVPDAMRLTLLLKIDARKMSPALLAAMPRSQHTVAEEAAPPFPLPPQPPVPATLTTTPAGVRRQRW